MNEWMDVWEGWKDRWMDGWMDGCKRNFGLTKFWFNEILQERKFALSHFTVQTD